MKVMPCWVVGLVCAVMACNSSAPPPKEAPLVDDRGQEVVLGAQVERLVSLAPSHTELLFALGLGGKVVGVTESCDFPAAAAQKAKVASFNSINLERVVELQPDLVIGFGGSDPEALRSLEQAGVVVYMLDIQSIAALLDGIETLGKLTGSADAAAQLKAQLRQRIEQVEKRVGGIEPKPRVLSGYWGEPIYTAGAGTFIDDVIERAGGTNVARQAAGAWPQVGLEAVIEWAPQVIITTYLPGAEEPGKMAAEIQRLRQTDGWSAIPAVVDGRLHLVEADWLLRPGPRLSDALEAVAIHLHGEPSGAP